MTTIKFGTDGWRAIIADDYTLDNVRRVSAATALWMQSKGQDKIVIGHDCRFGGEMFAQQVARVMGAFNIKVHLAKGFVSTPMVSLGVVRTKSFLGVVITASHNPPSYNGYKLKSWFGGAAVPDDIAEVEALIPAEWNQPTPTLDDMVEQGLLNYIDLESLYLNEVREKFNLSAIRASKMKVVFDAMYGAGQRVVPTLLGDAIIPMHCDDNPGFKGQAPEPISRNLIELSDYIARNPGVSCGLANDGDADRIGMCDENGTFVDSHHILLLLLLYMHKYKGMSGKVIITFSVTDKVKKMCEIFGLPYEVTKIGFKYITDFFNKEDVLLGGEESGGIAVKGHIPERDGVWVGLLILQFMAETGKTLKQLIREVYEIVGSFAFDRYDLHVENSRKEAIMADAAAGNFKSFGNLNVTLQESVDGHKFYFSDDKWVMLRASGTEPLLRVYAQAPSLDEARVILDTVKAALVG